MTGGVRASPVFATAVGVDAVAIVTVVSDVARQNGYGQSHSRSAAILPVPAVAGMSRATEFGIAGISRSAAAPPRLNVSRPRASVPPDGTGSWAIAEDTAARSVHRFARSVPKR